MEISRQKQFKIEQLKNNTYSQLGFTFKPAINKSSKYKVSETFEQRNYVNHYPNRESLLSRKKYGHSNKEVSSILSYCNASNNNDNIEFDNASKISVRTFNFNNNNNNGNNNYVNNKENSFSSLKQTSLKSKMIGNANKNSTPISNSNSLLKNDFSNTKKNKQGDNISNITNNNENTIRNDTNKNNYNNKTKSIKSSICNFSTAKNTPDLKGKEFINRITHESLNNQELKSNEENNNNYNINYKKSSKLQETRELVKRINSKVKSNSKKDLEFLDKTIDEVCNDNAFTENVSKKSQDKNIKNENSNYESGSRIADESKSNHFYKEEAIRNINDSKNRNKNYGNIIYSVNSNDNINKSIKSGSVILNNDKNNQENFNFNYSVSKTDGEANLDQL